ncbi:MAG: response regulator [Limnospira sp.]
MQPEQQERIMGYFIEEAKDHLNTIEQGLLNLQSTIEDSELLYEVYRAAHSVKGGAAMLGLHSIQKTAHRLEDSFKALEKITERGPLQIDQQLESLFLQIFDTLQALIDNLSGPYGLTEETSQSLLQEVEPVFDGLNYHLNSICGEKGVVLASAPKAAEPPPPAPAPAPPAPPREKPSEAIDSAEELFFRSDVPDRLREMLQLFKQQPTPAGRNRLLELCRGLGRAGETFDKPHWVNFLENVEQAIANPDNSYRTLAPVVIPQIKQAQDLILSNREDEIVVSSSLEDLLPQDLEDDAEDDPTLNEELLAELGVDATPDTPPLTLDDSPLDASPQSDQPSGSGTLLDLPAEDGIPQISKDDRHSPRGPAMQPEELKSLAALFEGVEGNGNEIERGWEEETPLERGQTADRDPSADDFNIFFDENSPDSDQPRSSGGTSEMRATGRDADFANLLFDGIEAAAEPHQTTAKPRPKSRSARRNDADDFIQQLLDLDNGESEEGATPTSDGNGFGSSESEDEDDLSFSALFDETETAVDAAPSAPTVAPSPPPDTDDGDWFEELVAGEEVKDPFQEPWQERRPTGESAGRPGDVSGTATDGEAEDDLFSELFGSSEVETTPEAAPQPAYQQADRPKAAPAEPQKQPAADSEADDDFAALDDLLNQPEESGDGDEMLSDLDRLLNEPEAAPATPDGDADIRATAEDEEFEDLAKLIEQPSTRHGTPRQPAKPQAPKFEPIAKVPVKQLDNLSNLIGELVVNRNSLEQDQERMRQFLDNLLDQVSLLSDVGQRMQDFYERSLLEISLLSNRQKPMLSSPHPLEDHDGGETAGFESTELDRFTPFHTLSQEIIELVVRVRESAADIEFLVEEADQVGRQLRQVTNQLQEGLNKARMEQFAQEADRLKRPVRDLSIKCGKPAELVVEGRDTLIDKMLLGKLRDPLTHLVNNAIAHGIEPPEVRQKAGKPATGKIAIKVFHQGNQTVLSVSDDGGGIDVDRVKQKAIQRQLISPQQAKDLPKHEIYDLLFRPGFTTQDNADAISGRGVGMDVVRTNLAEIRGTITTDSTLGEGTTFTIRLPLNMSISRALCCISDRARIAFPMDGVEDMIDVPREQIQTGPDGKLTLEWRGSVLPFRHLRELLTYKRHLGRGGVYGANVEEDMISVIVLRAAGNYLAVQVDQVLVEQEIVIKQLEGPVPKPVGVAGATVLGDGQIVAIADVLELIDLATDKIRPDAHTLKWDDSGAVEATEPIAHKNEPTVLIVDDSITVRSLLSMTFEKSGYRVEEARDGKEAWEKLKSGLPCDIVFCDIEMPRMDGLELLSRMQKDPALQELPIAMLTSRGADRHRQMAYQLGARGYFTKPYLEEQLLEAAGRMLRGEVVGKVGVPASS